MTIDAHHHFWQIARGDYGWLTPALGPIHRDFGPDDLAPILARHGIGRTILVQAAPTPAETRFLLDLAQHTPFVAGVVGWADFAAGDAADTIAALARDPLLVGLRPMVQDIADDDWLARPGLAPALRALIDNGLAFDALVLPRHLPRLLAVADRHPELRVVIDHGAKPPLRDRDAAAERAWAADIDALAARPQVSCKLSGLVTEAGPGWTASRLAPVVDRLVERFGADRLMWGSDWPVLNLAADYDRWIAGCATLLAGRSDADRAAIFGGTAARFYLAHRGRSC